MTVRQILAWLVAMLLILPNAVAEDYVVRSTTRFPIPERYQLVNDHAAFLRIARVPVITKKLQALERRNGSQIVFLSVPNVGDEGVRAYAEAVWAKWDIGNNGQGNGLLFLASPEGWYIMTGPGIAGAIPDVSVARIGRKVLQPGAQRDQLSEAVESTLDALIQAASGEHTAPTAYDYAHPFIPTTREQVMVAVLTGLALAYAGCLLWFRWRRRRLGTP